MRVRTISQKTRPECSEVTGVRSTRTVFQDRESDDAVSAYYGRIHWISADDSVAGWGGFDSTTGKAGAWKVTTGGDFYRRSSSSNADFVSTLSEENLRAIAFGHFIRGKKDIEESVSVPVKKEGLLEKNRQIGSI